jgi:hypothetical protein
MKLHSVVGAEKDYPHVNRHHQANRPTRRDEDVRNIGAALA